jgi:hypothetical protein
LAPRARGHADDGLNDRITGGRIELAHDFAEPLVSGIGVVRPRKRREGREADRSTFLERLQEPTCAFPIREPREIERISLQGAAP